ncbi:iron aquisition yersiniabactin synthesis enzyme (Irp1,polyketide synthetase) [Klebsiella michiganensis]|nr:iron aquisition yersiniabactin synthesis enzyme (Irp1,polyketide synthetase) [Klebsiella michiganensis]
MAQNLTLQAAEAWIDNIAHLLRLLTEHTPDETVPLPCLIVHAAMRPARWTPAETEWQPWIDRADSYAIKGQPLANHAGAPPTFRPVRSISSAGSAQPQRNRRTRYDVVRPPLSYAY